MPHHKILTISSFLFILLALPLHHASAVQDQASSNQFVPTPTHDFGDNNPDVYVALGDSITYGVFLNNRSESYPAKLQELLGKTILNEGIPGDRSYHGAYRAGSVLNRHKPGYLLILYGVNDIGERTNEAIIQNLRQIIHTAKHNKTIPVIATLTPIFGGRAWKEPFARDLNIRIRSLANEQGIILVDLEETFAWDASMFPDGLHPDSRGHELMAQTFYDALKKESSGGGGCTFNPQARFGLEWFVILFALLFKIIIRFFAPRQRKNLQ